MAYSTPWELRFVLSWKLFILRMYSQLWQTAAGSMYVAEVTVRWGPCIQLFLLFSDRIFFYSVVTFIGGCMPGPMSTASLYFHIYFSCSTFLCQISYVLLKWCVSLGFDSFDESLEEPFSLATPAFSSHKWVGTSWFARSSFPQCTSSWPFGLWNFNTKTIFRCFNTVKYC